MAGRVCRDSQHAACGVLACITATVFGVIAGVLRLSNNWLVRKLMAFYVEIFRNMPVLIWIIIIFTIMTAVLPGPRAFGAEPSRAMFLDLLPLPTGASIRPRRFGTRALVSWCCVHRVDRRYFRLSPLCNATCSTRRATCFQHAGRHWRFCCADVLIVSSSWGTDRLDILMLETASTCRVASKSVRR